MTSGNNPVCGACRDIPTHMKVELLHTEERLPIAVERLTVIGGAGFYCAEQLRTCPACGAYFSFIHDHDSEAGLGFGWTDEVIRRIGSDDARVLATEAADRARNSIQYWAAEAASGSTSAEQDLAESRIDLARLEAELKQLAEALPRRPLSVDRREI